MLLLISPGKPVNLMVDVLVADLLAELVDLIKDIVLMLLRPLR